MSIDTVSPDKGSRVLAASRNRTRQASNVRKLPRAMEAMRAGDLISAVAQSDREKCLKAGASDHLARPVDSEQLFSALHLLLHR